MASATRWLPMAAAMLAAAALVAVRLGGAAFLTPGARGAAPTGSALRGSRGAPGTTRAEAIPNWAPGAEGSQSAVLVVATACALGLAAAGLRRADARRASRVARRGSIIPTRVDQAIPWWNRTRKPRSIEKGVGLWAEKLNQTTLYSEGPLQAKVTSTILCIKRGGNYVVDKQWPEKHGQYAVSVAYDRYSPIRKYMSKEERFNVGRCEKANLPPMKKIASFSVRPQDWDKWEIGQKVSPSDLFKEGDLVDITGYTVSRKYNGAITRWGQKRGPMEHGSKHHRQPGSLGAGLGERSRKGRVLPLNRGAGWTGGKKKALGGVKVMKVIENIDDDNMPESIICVQGQVPGYDAYDQKKGGSYVSLCPNLNRSDGRFKRDPVYAWLFEKGTEGTIKQYIPIKNHAWTLKTEFGRDVRWIKHEVKKYWPDGFPGYDNDHDPFYDNCDEIKAIKAPEW